MDIVVHGTKGGRQIFTPKKVSGLLDVNADASKASAIGQETFAIRFVGMSAIFSKYKIIRDVLGDKRTGFIGFSLFLPNNEKLSGADIVALLNRVSEEYYERYIPENDNNLRDVREDWTSLNIIEKEYQSKVKMLPAEHIETLQSGSKHDAFIYYKDSEELQKYFDGPYQEEYCEYRQVFFVIGELKGKPENPLNALRHSENDLTGKIDLENPRYKLIYNQTAKGGLTIDVKVNGKTRSSRNKIRRKDILDVTWTKPHHETVSKKGTWNEIGGSFIDVHDTSEAVHIKEIELTPLTKTTTIRVRDWRGNPVEDADVRCTGQGQSKVVTENNRITFKGSELGQQWRISAKWGDNFRSDGRIIDFESETVDLTLDEYKEVTFSGVFNGGGKEQFFPGCELQIKVSGKNSCHNESKIQFKNEEIEKQIDVEATYKRGDDYFSGTASFRPKEKDSVQIQLKKVPKYWIDTNEHGTIGMPNKKWTYELNGKDIVKYIKPKRGWKFMGFKIDLNRKINGCDGTLIAQYKKKKFFISSTGILVSAVILLIAVVGIYLFVLKPNPKYPEESLKDEIVAYTEGMELNADILENYEKQWERQKEERIDSTESKTKEEVLSSIKRAKEKRAYINSGEFTELIRLDYSEAQQGFKKAILRIDSLKQSDSVRYDTLKNRLRDVSSWSLNRIVDAINTFLGLITNIANPEGSLTPPDSSSVRESDASRTADGDAGSAIQTDSGTSPSKTPTDQNSGAGKENDISKALKSNSISKEQLEQWNEVRMDKLENSIGLYLQFWDLVLANNVNEEKYDDLRDKVEKDDILKNSELKSFLDYIKGAKNFEDHYQSRIGKAPKTQNTTLSQLKNQLNK